MSMPEVAESCLDRENLIKMETPPKRNNETVITITLAPEYRHPPPLFRYDELELTQSNGNRGVRRSQQSSTNSCTQQGKTLGNCLGNCCFAICKCCGVLLLIAIGIVVMILLRVGVGVLKYEVKNALFENQRTDVKYVQFPFPSQRPFNSSHFIANLLPPDFARINHSTKFSHGFETEAERKKDEKLRAKLGLGAIDLIDTPPINEPNKREFDEKPLQEREEDEKENELLRRIIKD